MSATITETTLDAAQPADAAPAREGAGVLVLVDQLLRDRAGLLARIEAGVDLVGVARAMIVTIIACAAVFGAALGLNRGGAQIAFAAIKLPLVILLTAGLCAPAVTALRHVVEGHSSIRRDLALVLSSLALGSLVIAALAPVVMLAVSWGAGYHALILLAVGCCAVGGAVGLSLFVSGTKGIAAGSRVLIMATALVLVGLVGSQMTWTLRPYLVRPRTEHVPFLRQVEGGFLDSVSTSSWSAAGVYRERAVQAEPDDWSEGRVAP